MKKWWAVWIASLGFLLGAWALFHNRPVKLELEWAPGPYFSEPTQRYTTRPEALRVSQEAHAAWDGTGIEPACRVKRILVKWRKLPLNCATTTRIHLRVYYLRGDGRQIDMTRCMPNGVTWNINTSHPLELGDAGFNAWILDVYEGEKISVWAGTWQEGAPDLTWEREITVPVGY